MPDSATLSTVASIIAGFGVAMLFFRIQRELQMQGKQEIIWIPMADWLLIAATLVAILFVILPLILLGSTSFGIRFAAGACTACAIMVAGYVVSILAHYRLIFGRNRIGPRTNPEPAERFLVWLTGTIAALSFGAFVALK